MLRSLLCPEFSPLLPFPPKVWNDLRWCWPVQVRAYMLPASAARELRAEYPELYLRLREIWILRVAQVGLVTQFGFLAESLVVV